VSTSVAALLLSMGRYFTAAYTLVVSIVFLTAEED
jgi:hypothetical protein